MKKHDKEALKQLQARVAEARVEATLESDPALKQKLLADVEKGEEFVKRLEEELSR